MVDKPKATRGKLSATAQVQTTPAPAIPDAATQAAPVPATLVAETQATPVSSTAPAAPVTQPDPAVPAVPEAPSSVAAGVVVDGDQIRMLTGQEGPELSRVCGQELTVGVDLGAGEANRLLDADFAERV